MNNLSEFLENGINSMSDVARYILPFAAFIILIVCTASLLRNRPRVTTLAHLINLANGDKIPLEHWETSIGRSNSCDLCLAYNTVSRFHAVIARRKGKWMIYDTQSKPGIMINDEKIDRKAELFDGDKIILGTAVLTFCASDVPKREQNQTIKEDDSFNINIPYNENPRIEYFEDISSHSANCAAFVNEDLNVRLYLTEDSAAIGSAENAGLRCSKAYVAPYHARVKCINGMWVLDNFASRNDIWINGSPLKSAQRLYDGDNILIGRLYLTFYENYGEGRN